eukprot:13453503-Ditylum_brightwellii.AAC.1
MDNSCTVHIADKLELIVSFCIPKSVDPTMNQKWKKMMLHYHASMIKIHQKTDFVNAVTSKFQE